MAGRMAAGRQMVAVQRGPGPRGTREFREVRHPAYPALRVEHVWVGPTGVHVITALAPGPESTAEAAQRARTAAQVVAELLPHRYHARVRPILCRTDGAEVADHVEDVLVTSAVPLRHILRSSPVVLSTSEICDIAVRLDTFLQPFPTQTVPRPERPAWWRALLPAAAAVVTGAVALAILAPLPGDLPAPW